MKLFLNGHEQKKRFRRLLWNAAADGKISAKTLRKVISKQKYSLRSYMKKERGIIFPAEISVYKRIVAVLVVASLSLYVANMNFLLKNATTAANQLSEQNSSLSDRVDTLGSALDETSGKLDSINEAMNDTQSKLEDTEGKLHDAITDAEDKQTQIDEQKELLDNLESEEEARREELENTIADLIDTFGISTQSRSGGELYDSIDKIDTAKSIIVTYLSDNPNAASYLKALDEEKSVLEDKVRRYPDCEPTTGTLTSRFGSRTYRNNSGRLVTDYHNGIDIANSSNVSVYSCAYGTVTDVINSGSSGLGLHIKIDHGNGFVSVYGHLLSVNVKVGQTVEKGQKIAVMGSSGVATGTHLHVEIFLNGVRQNPLNYIYTYWK